LPFPFNPFNPFFSVFPTQLSFCLVRPCRNGNCRSGWLCFLEIRIERIERMRKRIASERGDGFVRMESGISLVGN
jgi:hypothetical protein